MSQIFTDVGEFRRGKGNRQTRLGPRMRIENSYKRNEQRTPDDIAIQKLLKMLKRPGLERSERYTLAKIMTGAEQIRFMNMQVLAEVLLFWSNEKQTIDGGGIFANIADGYIDSFLSRSSFSEDAKKNSNVDPQIIKLRMLATFIRYYNYIEMLISQRKQLIQDGVYNPQEINDPEYY